MLRSRIWRKDQRMKQKFVFTIIAAMVFAGAGIRPAWAATPPATGYTPQQEWFRDAGFGMFIHWGVYSVIGDGEWVMENHKMSVADYEKVPPQFNPTEFDAAEWVALAKNAGMKYITITSKHHDGFAMFASRQSDWNVVDRTPYKKDPLKMLADECHKQGLKLFFYYSELDWHNPDYFPLGRTGHASGRPPAGNWNKYLDYMDAQLTELLTNYGPIGGIWFDGWWDKPDSDWRLQQTYALIHRLQPAALIGSNHHHKPNPGEDFQMFEKDLPGQKTASFNKDSEVGTLPLETCDTISGAWGYNKNDKRYKSVPDLVHYLVRAAGNNANFLLNVGPMPSGKIQPEFVDRLKGVGEWLSKNGESIYGTRGGPIAPQSWGVTTQKGNKVYVHLLTANTGALVLPKMNEQIVSASLLQSGEKLDARPIDRGTLFILPPSVSDSMDVIIVLETQ